MRISDWSSDVCSSDLLDSKGCIRHDRPNLDTTKAEFATTEKIASLADALKGADVFIGLSKGDVVTAEMLTTMAKNPIVFAMANPRSEEHTSELQSLMRISYAVFCLKKNTIHIRSCTIYHTI